MNGAVAWLVGLVLILVAGVRADDPSPLVLEGPDGAPRKDMEACAKALVARCKDYGYEGVVASVVEIADANSKDGKTNRVEVTCATGITQKMRNAVLAFVAMPCRSAVLRYVRELREHESDQYEVGRAAPKGASWVELTFAPDRQTPMDGGMPAKTTILLFDAPIIDLRGNVSWRTSSQSTSPYAPLTSLDSKEHYYEFTVGASKTIASQAKDFPEGRPIYFIVDGVAHPMIGCFCWPDAKNSNDPSGRCVWTGPAAKDEMLGIALNHPMPCAISPIGSGSKK